MLFMSKPLCILRLCGAARLDADLACNLPERLRMIIAETLADARAALESAHRSGRPIGFVPTMGALHDGHWSLVERARSECDAVAVSIFVNPLQFGPNEDFEKYPRSREADLAGCRERGVLVAFCPGREEMYPEKVLTSIRVDRLTDTLCGRFRPGHFDGVCTVVCKLFNIIQPDFAYFGEKDFQQLTVIRRMVSDLSMPVRVVGCPIVREPDGLALSSRNAYLSPEYRRRAIAIHEALEEAVRLAASGRRDAATIVERIRARIAEGGFDRIDYVSVVDGVTLEDRGSVAPGARICVAAYLGGTRLIDNVEITA
jgi:pantoate--beta-alanine ligase